MSKKKYQLRDSNGNLSGFTLKFVDNCSGSGEVLPNSPEVKGFQFFNVCIGPNGKPTKGSHQLIWGLEYKKPEGDTYGLN